MTDTHTLLHEAEQLLYREARLLDSWQFREWLTLFTDDVRYLIPIRETLQHSPEGLHDESADVVVHHVDEDLAGLELRVRRYETGRAHAEEPRSRSRRFVTNVELIDVERDAASAQATVASNLLLFQGRRDCSEFLFSATRRDVLRRANGSWLIARRAVLLDHTVLPRPLTQFL